MNTIYDHIIAYVLPNGAIAETEHRCDHNGRTACGITASSNGRWEIRHESDPLPGGRLCRKCAKALRKMGDA